MLGAVCHDLGKPPTTAFIDGRIRSLDHEEEGVAPATALLDRLNIQSLQGYDVRREVLGIVAHHLKPGMFQQGAAARQRRGIPPARAESGPRAARAGRASRLRGSRRRVRLLRDGLVRGARARARRRARAAGAARQGTAPAGAGREPRTCARRRCCARSTSVSSTDASRRSTTRSRWRGRSRRRGSYTEAHDTGTRKPASAVHSRCALLVGARRPLRPAAGTHRTVRRGHPRKPGAGTRKRRASLPTSASRRPTCRRERSASAAACTSIRCISASSRSASAVTW